MNKKQLKLIKAKIDYTKTDGRYANLADDELAKYYRFALGGYVTKGKFLYADTQSMSKYIDVLLVKEYMVRLAASQGVEVAQKEYQRVQSLGYLYSTTLNGTTVLCTSEGLNHIKNLQQ